MKAVMVFFFMRINIKNNTKAVTNIDMSKNETPKTPDKIFCLRASIDRDDCVMII